MEIKQAKKVQLSERNREFLYFLGRCGVLTCEQVSENFFEGRDAYCRRRLAELAGSNYLRRHNGYVIIKPKGLRAVNSEQKDPSRIKPDRYERLSTVAELAFDLPEWEVEFAVEAKRRYGLNKTSLFDAHIRFGDKRYNVYLLSNDPHISTVGRIQKEIEKLRHFGYTRVIVLCPTPAAMNAFGPHHLGLDELLRLPYNPRANQRSGVMALRHRCSAEFEEFIARRFPGAVAEGRRRLADYQWGDKHICVLTTNDSVRRDLLKAYYDGLDYRTSHNDVIIVCYRDQLEPYKQFFPQAEYVVAPDPLEP